ncbi:MAG: dihydroorotase [Spirochaetales bacterium]|nr:dihydroorotase [Spirochaetales bacterium]
MIDPHVHLRDWKQANKETLEHGLNVAIKAGLDGVFEMPNTNPSLTTNENILKRLTQVDTLNLPIFHGIYGGLTAKQDQIDEILETQRHLFPRVVGLKLYAGESTGTLSVEGTETQKNILAYLAEKKYQGLLALHCEEVSLFKAIYDVSNPITHSFARPPESEIRSIERILDQAEALSFKGHLHFCHISVPEAVIMINNHKKRGKLRLSCGVTPHHVLADNSLMNKSDGYLWKMNPPLRAKEMQQLLFKMLINGEIDWIETDHAPHLLTEKKQASGIPGFPIYPHLISILKNNALTEGDINILTHSNIEKAFQFNIKQYHRTPDMNLFHEYEYDPFADLNR